MLRGITENGEMKNVRVNDRGELVIQNQEQAMEVVQTSDREVVLNASVLILSTESTEIEINKKITNISVANYSETGDITLTIGTKVYQIGSSLAIDFPINEVVQTISLVSTETNTKTQIVVKGVE